MPPGDLAPVIATSIFFIAFASVLILRGPLGRALARRIEGGSSQGDAAPQRALADLQGRVADLEQQVVRVQELEERLDFAERLIVQGRSEAARLPGGADGRT